MFVQIEVTLVFGAASYIYHINTLFFELSFLKKLYLNYNWQGLGVEIGFLFASFQLIFP